MVAISLTHEALQCFSKRSNNHCSVCTHVLLADAKHGPEDEGILLKSSQSSAPADVPKLATDAPRETGICRIDRHQGSTTFRHCYRKYSMFKTSLW